LEHDAIRYFVHGYGPVNLRIRTPSPVAECPSADNRFGVHPENNLENPIIIRFPSISVQDHDFLLAEKFYHVQRLPKQKYEVIAEFYQKHCESDVPDRKSPFPSPDVLDTFIQLYFEHFHPTMPVLHVPTFEPSRSSWVLLLALSAVGSQYSAISTRKDFSGALTGFLRQGLLNHVR
jgi:hypothetical protein